MKEFTITGRFHFDDKVVIDAKDEAEALKIARQTLVQMCKDMLKDSDNVFLQVDNNRTLTTEEVKQDIKDGILLEKEVKTRDLKEPKAKKSYYKPKKKQVEEVVTEAPKKRKSYYIPKSKRDGNK